MLLSRQGVIWGLGSRSPHDAWSFSGMGQLGKSCGRTKDRCNFILLPVSSGGVLCGHGGTLLNLPVSVKVIWDGILGPTGEPKRKMQAQLALKGPRQDHPDPLKMPV